MFTQKSVTIFVSNNRKKTDFSKRKKTTLNCLKYLETKSMSGQKAIKRVALQYTAHRKNKVRNWEIPKAKGVKQ